MSKQLTPEEVQYMRAEAAEEKLRGARAEIEKLRRLYEGCHDALNKTAIAELAARSEIAETNRTSKGLFDEAVRLKDEIDKLRARIASAAEEIGGNE